MKQTLLTICLIVFALPSWGDSPDGNPDFGFLFLFMAIFLVFIFVFNFNRLKNGVIKTFRRQPVVASIFLIFCFGGYVLWVIYEAYFTLEIKKERE